MQLQTVTEGQAACAQTCASVVLTSEVEGALQDLVPADACTIADRQPIAYICQTCVCLASLECGWCHLACLPAD